MRRITAVALMFAAFNLGVLVQYTLDASFVRRSFHSAAWGLCHNVQQAAAVNEQAINLLKGK